MRRGREVFAGVAAEVEIRNEARVHLWYEEKFGVPCPPYASTDRPGVAVGDTLCELCERVREGGVCCS